MSDPLASAVQTLLRRLHGQHPLRGGSLIVTLFGDAIAPRGGVITLGSLIRIATLFRLTERLVRTSVARLAHDGWLVGRRHGRQSEYRLAPGGEQRFADATRRIYGAGPGSWCGEWTLIVLRSAARERIRDELRWLGFGQISPGTFAHPNCTQAQAREWIQTLEDAADALILRSSSGQLAADRQVASLGWDLGELTRRYRRFLDTFEPVEAAVRGSRPLEPERALVIRTLLIHEYRKIHLQDPLLPAALLPEGWVGATAYELSKRLYARVFDAAERFLSVSAATVGGPLPPAHDSVYERFGGIGSTRLTARTAR